MELKSGGMEKWWNRKLVEREISGIEKWWN